MARFVNMDELPLEVYDMPISLEGDDMGWGFVKKLTRKAKRTFNRATKPVRRIARTATWPARKAYKTVVPRSVRRGIRRGTRKFGRFAKKYGKYAIAPGLMLITHTAKLLVKLGMAIIKKYFGGAVKKLTRRRARYMAYQRRGSSRPTQQEMLEAARWARKYTKSQGLFGKLTAAVTKKSKQLAKDPSVRRKVAAGMRNQRAPSGVRGHTMGEAVSAATVTAMIPVIIALINAFMNKAAKQGAPADPRQASPEQNLMGEISQGYMRQSMQGLSQPGGPSYDTNPLQHAMMNYGVRKAQEQYGPLGGMAAGYLTQSFRPPVSRQPAMTYNYPEPEPASFDFPPPPDEIYF